MGPPDECPRNGTVIIGGARPERIKLNSSFLFSFFFFFLFQHWQLLELLLYGRAVSIVIVLRIQLEDKHGGTVTIKHQYRPCFSSCSPAFLQQAKNEATELRLSRSVNSVTDFSCFNSLRHTAVPARRGALNSINVLAAAAAAALPLSLSRSLEQFRQDAGKLVVEMEGGGRGHGDQRTPESVRAWSPEPASPVGRKIPVVYYLCRNRHLEHPHFIQVPLSSPDGLFLRGHSR